MSRFPDDLAFLCFGLAAMVAARLGIEWATCRRAARAAPKDHDHGDGDGDGRRVGAGPRPPRRTGGSPIG